MKEIWKDLTGYENLYQISNYGRLQRFKNNRFKILKGCIFKGKNNYIYFDISKNGIRKRIIVHIEVAKHFISNPLNKPQVNHKDGNKQNPKSSNLEWCTSSENNLHAIRTGLVHHRGEKNGSATMNDKEAKIIIKRLKNNECLKTISNETGLSERHLRSIRKGDYWKHIII